MNYSSVKFDIISSSNMDTTNIFQILAIFAQNFLKKKMHF